MKKGILLLSLLLIIIGFNQWRDSQASLKSPAKPYLGPHFFMDPASGQALMDSIVQGTQRNPLALQKVAAQMKKALEALKSPTDAYLSRRQYLTVVSDYFPQHFGHFNPNHSWYTGFEQALSRRFWQIDALAPKSNLIVYLVQEDIPTVFQKKILRDTASFDPNLRVQHATDWCQKIMEELQQRKIAVSLSQKEELFKDIDATLKQMTGFYPQGSFAPIQLLISDLNLMVCYTDAQGNELKKQQVRAGIVTQIVEGL